MQEEVDAPDAFVYSILDVPLHILPYNAQSATKGPETAQKVRGRHTSSLKKHLAAWAARKAQDTDTGREGEEEDDDDDEEEEEEAAQLMPCGDTCGAASLCHMVHHRERNAKGVMIKRALHALGGGPAAATAPLRVPPAADKKAAPSAETDEKPTEKSGVPTESKEPAPPTVSAAKPRPVATTATTTTMAAGATFGRTPGAKIGVRRSVQAKTGALSVPLPEAGPKCTVVGSRAATEAKKLKPPT